MTAKIDNETGANPSNQPEWEWLQLPEQPQDMTFRGRYNAQDKAVLELGDIKNLPAGIEISVLDFGGGVLPFGSPTAHDLVDSIESTGHKSVITVIDKQQPTEVGSDYPQVSYYPSITEARARSYDIVRMLHVIEHLPSSEYESYRQQVVDHLREGGLFVATQRITYQRNHEADPQLKPPIIKIMQKRGGLLVPIALLPDSVVPWNGGLFSSISDYEPYRNEVLEGLATIPHQLDQEGFKNTLARLNLDLDDATRCLSVEDYFCQTAAYRDPKSFEIIYPHNGDILEKLQKNALGTEISFRSAY